MVFCLVRQSGQLVQFSWQCLIEYPLIIVHTCVFKLMQDEDGDTALIKACRHGHIETARVLLDHGAIVNYKNKVYKEKITNIHNHR